MGVRGAKPLHCISSEPLRHDAACLQLAFASLKFTFLAPGPPLPNVTVSCQLHTPCTLPGWLMMM